MSIGNFAINELFSEPVEKIVHNSTIRNMSEEFFGAYGGTFGKRIRLLRQDRQWTQIKLAEEARAYGVDIRNTWISELENADENKLPSIDVVIAFAKLLGTTTDFLLLLSNDPKPPNNNTDPHWSEQADEAAGLIDLMPGKWRSRALKLVRDLDAEYRLALRQSQEIAEMLERVESVGGREARTIIERFIQSRRNDLPGDDDMSP